MMNLNYIMKKWMTIGLTAMLLTSSFPVNFFAAEAEIPETELTGEVQTESEDEASVEEAAQGKNTDVSDIDGLRDALGTGGEITLTNDINVDMHLLISDGVSVSLDLAGHTLDYSGSNEGPFNADDPDIFFGAIVVMENCSLTIKDSAGNGKITGGSDENANKALVVYGSCIIQSGSISGGVLAGDSQNHQSGNISMNGGKMENCLLEVNGDFTMNGGTISNHDADEVVEISNPGAFTLNAGTISGIDIENSVVDVTDSFTMNGGRVSGSGKYGGVRIGGTAIIYISGNPKIDEYVYFDSGRMIWIDGSLTEGAHIPFITSSRDYPVQITSGPVFRI